MAGDVDLGPLVQQQHPALPALEDERRDADIEERLRVTGSGFDLLLVADHDVRMARGGLRELDVCVRLLPERRSPVEVEDRQALVFLERGQGRLTTRRLREGR